MRLSLENRGMVILHRISAHILCIVVFDRVRYRGIRSATETDGRINIMFSVLSVSCEWPRYYEYCYRYYQSYRNGSFPRVRLSVEPFWRVFCFCAHTVGVPVSLSTLLCNSCAVRRNFCCESRTITHRHRFAWPFCTCARYVGQGSAIIFWVGPNDLEKKYNMSEVRTFFF